MVKVAEVRQTMLSLMVALSQARDTQAAAASEEQLRLWHVFNREGALALDQVQISGPPDEPRSAREWMKQVSGSVGGLKVLIGDSLYAEADLCQAIPERGKDYMVKLKKPAEAVPGCGTALC